MRLEFCWLCGRIKRMGNAVALRKKMKFRGMRRGTAAVDTLLVTASFVVATFVFLKLGMLVIHHYFVDGSQLSRVPLF